MLRSKFSNVHRSQKKLMLLYLDYYMRTRSVFDAQIYIVGMHFRKITPRVVIYAIVVVFRQVILIVVRIYPFLVPVKIESRILVFILGRHKRGSNSICVCDGFVVDMLARIAV